MKRKLIWVVQLLFALCFIFSGIVKCIDPAGTAIKITEYLRFFGLDMLTDLSMGIAWLLSIVEFCCGFNLLLGHARYLSLATASLLLLAFTPLTLWLALTGAIEDCGCFGDAVHLTGWQTFFKNLVLVAMLVVLWWKRGSLYRLHSSTFYTFYIYWAFGCAVWLCWLGTWREPFIDFRPFKPGTDLQQSVIGEEADSKSVSFTCIYQKDGQQREFPLDSIPDEADGWEFVTTVEYVAVNAVSPNHIDFYVKNDEGAIFTERLLTTPGYTILLLSHSLDRASQHDIDRIEQLSEYAEDNGYPFYCITARDAEQLDRWRYNTGAEYPFLFTDASIVQTICRSNPGVMLLHNGIICWKQPLSQLDVQALTSGKLNEQTSGHIEENEVTKRILLLLFLLFAPFPLFLLLEIAQKHQSTIKKDSKDA